MDRERELTRLLECPVCFSITENEMFNCELGHSICSGCRTQLLKCVICSRPYTDSRNFIAESMAAYLSKFGLCLGVNSCSPTPTLVYCANKGDGCQRNLVHESELEDHQIACKFRPIKCNLETPKPCVEEIKFSEYFQHLIRCHKIKGMRESAGIFTKIDRAFIGLEINVTWPVFYLQYDGQTFLRHACIRNRYLLWWVSIIGSEKEARKYEAVICLKSPNKIPLKISWTLPIHCVRVTVHEVEHCKGLASLSTQQMLSFCLLNEPFEDRIATHTWSVYIRISRID